MLNILVSQSGIGGRHHGLSRRTEGGVEGGGHLVVLGMGRVVMAIV